MLRISAFMHGHRHPELAKKLNDKIPKMVDEMFERVRAFIRGGGEEGVRDNGGVWRVEWKGGGDGSGVLWWGCLGLGGVLDEVFMDVRWRGLKWCRVAADVIEDGVGFESELEGLGICDVKAAGCDEGGVATSVEAS
ncbi:hypothetical protein Tco_0189556 [Tanacetum coccineum]